MEFKELIKLDNDTLIGYFVFHEHTLGYLFPSFGQLGLGVLGAKILKGGINWKNGPILIHEWEFQSVK
jgi:hypothetical protein